MLPHGISLDGPLQAFRRRVKSAAGVSGREKIPASHGVVYNEGTGTTLTPRVSLCRMNDVFASFDAGALLVYYDGRFGAGQSGIAAAHRYHDRPLRVDVLHSRHGPTMPGKGLASLSPSRRGHDDG